MTGETFTRGQKADELKREIKMREVVFPGLVAKGKMRQAESDRRIAILRAVLADYEGAAPTPTTAQDRG